jgi:hypothetical protein
MTRYALPLLMLSVAACNADPCEKDPAAADCETAAPLPEDTDTVDTDPEEEPLDTDEPEPEPEPEPDPTIYEDASFTIEFEDVDGWSPFSASAPAIGSGDYSLTVGASVNGYTDVTMDLVSKVSQAPDGEWRHRITGVDDGGTMTPRIDISFPIVATLNGTDYDLTSLVGGFLPEISRDFPTATFDSALFFDDGGGDAFLYEATTINQSWSWEDLDPCTFCPFIDLDIEATVDFNSVYATESISTYPDDGDDGYVQSTRDGYAVISDLIPEGDEPNRLDFTSYGFGFLLNQIDIELDLDVVFTAAGVSVPVSAPLSFDFVDPAYWIIAFDAEDYINTKAD